MRLPLNILLYDQQAINIHLRRKKTVSSRSEKKIKYWNSNIYAAAVGFHLLLSHVKSSECSNQIFLKWKNLKRGSRRRRWWLMRAANNLINEERLEKSTDMAVMICTMNLRQSGLFYTILINFLWQTNLLCGERLNADLWSPFRALFLSVVSIKLLYHLFCVFARVIFLTSSWSDLNSEPLEFQEKSKIAT